jgi:hypothetical protein
MGGLHGEGIAVIPNIRAYRALRELKRIGAGGTVDERLHGEVERLARELADLCGVADAAAANAERLDLCGTSRR